MSPSDPPVSASCSARVTSMHDTMCDFYIGSGNWNSGPHVGKISALNPHSPKDTFL